MDAAVSAAALPPGSDRTIALRDAAGGIGEWVIGQWEGDAKKVRHAHAILHADDEVKIWDQSEQIHVDAIKPLHVHIAVAFESRQTSAPVEKLAGLVGLPPQQIEVSKTRGGAPAEVGDVVLATGHDNFLSYLTHIKYPDKHQYPPEQVATVRGLDFTAIWDLRRQPWISARAHIKAKKASMAVEELREAVLQGEVTRDQMLLSDDLYAIYSRNMRVLDDAVEAYGQRRAYRAAAALRAGDFSTTVIYIWGPSGSGKSRFAQNCIEDAIRAVRADGQRWDLYRAASANPLDNWNGEEVILLDDARPGTMRANDWLLLLDPYNANPAKARYQNKSEVAPRMVVITCTEHPVDFFYFSSQKGEVDEALDQFMRRLASIVRVCRPDKDLGPVYHYTTVDRVPPYQKELTFLDRRQLGPGHPSTRVRTSTLVNMNFGEVDESEHSEQGAIGRCISELALRSPDVDFSNGEDWNERQIVVHSERLQSEFFELLQEGDLYVEEQEDQASIFIDGPEFSFDGVVDL